MSRLLRDIGTIEWCPGSRAQQIYRCGFSAALRLGPWHAREARTLRLAADAVRA